MHCQQFRTPAKSWTAICFLHTAQSEQDMPTMSLSLRTRRCRPGTSSIRTQIKSDSFSTARFGHCLLMVVPRMRVLSARLNSCAPLIRPVPRSTRNHNTDFSPSGAHRSGSTAFTDNERYRRLHHVSSTNNGIGSIDPPGCSRATYK